MIFWIKILILCNHFDVKICIATTVQDLLTLSKISSTSRHFWDNLYLKKHASKFLDHRLVKWIRPAEHLFSLRGFDGIHKYLLRHVLEYCEASIMVGNVVSEINTNLRYRTPKTGEINFPLYVHGRQITLKNYSTFNKIFLCLKFDVFS